MRPWTVDVGLTASAAALGIWGITGVAARVHRVWGGCGRVGVKREIQMKTMRRTRRVLATLAAAVAVVQPAVLAQGTSPWVDAVANLSTAFTGPIARGLALVSIVVGGLMFAFGEGGSKSALAGIIFGLGMALGAANFITWMF